MLVILGNNRRYGGCRDPYTKLIQNDVEQVNDMLGRAKFMVPAFVAVMLGCALVLVGLIIMWEHPVGVTADAQLVGRINQAEHSHIEKETIEEFVGRKASLNTQRPGERVVWDEMLSVSRDENEKSGASMDEVNKATDVVYWRRLLESGDPEIRIIGIIWTKNQKMKVFYAILHRG